MVGFQSRHDTWFRYWMIHSFSWWGRFVKISPRALWRLKIHGSFLAGANRDEQMSKRLVIFPTKWLNGPSKGVQLGSVQNFPQWLLVENILSNHQKKKGQKRRCGGLAICDVWLFFLMFWAAKCDGFGSGKVLKRHGVFRRFLGGDVWWFLLGDMVRMIWKYCVSPSIHHQTNTN